VAAAAGTAAWVAAIAEGAAATAAVAEVEEEGSAAAEAGCARPAAEWASAWPLRLDVAPACE